MLNKNCKYPFYIQIHYLPAYLFSTKIKETLIRSFSRNSLKGSKVQSRPYFAYLLTINTLFTREFIFHCIPSQQKNERNPHEGFRQKSHHIFYSGLYYAYLFYQNVIIHQSPMAYVEFWLEFTHSGYHETKYIVSQLIISPHMIVFLGMPYSTAILAHQ